MTNEQMKFSYNEEHWNLNTLEVAINKNDDLVIYMPTMGQMLSIWSVSECRKRYENAPTGYDTKQWKDFVINQIIETESYEEYHTMLIMRIMVKEQSMYNNASKLYKMITK